MTDNPKPLPITEEELAELFTFNPAPGEAPEPEEERTVWALAWFPEDEWHRATQRWPDLLDSMPADHGEYSRTIEGHLKAAAAREPGTPDVAPLHVDELVETFGDDAGEPLSRASLGAQVARRGDALPWPPTRNDPCWCRSGRKYKACCGPTPASH